MREPAETPVQVPANAPAAPAATTPPERLPADAEAWQRWDRAAERLRDVGATVRPSSDPLRLEAVVSQMADDEALIVARNAFNVLGAAEAELVILDGANTQLARATIGGVTGR